MVEYSYDVWGNIRNVFGDMASTLGQDNPIRYRGYYYDNETKLYYVLSRYYNPELCRFINPDSIIDIRGLNTLNPYAYCGNNPVNNEDSNGHLFVGAIVGGIVGGVLGGIGALASGKSVVAGVVTGAATGAAIGYICDSIATGGLAIIAMGSVVAAGIAAAGNVANQIWNYHIEKRKGNSSNRKNTSINSNAGMNTTGGKELDLDKGLASYIDYKSVAISAVSAMVFAPVSVGAGKLVEAGFQGLNGGAIDFVAKAITNTIFGINTSSLQAVVERVMEVLFH